VPSYLYDGCGGSARDFTMTELSGYRLETLWADLAAAEIARIEGRELDAERLYEEAIRRAREQGFIQNEGLANELAARFHAARGFETIADAYLRKARHCYLRWGAEGKVRQLDRNHPHLRAEAYLAEAQRLSLTGSFSWSAASGEIFWSAETFRIFDCDPAIRPTVELALQRTHPEDLALVQQTIDRVSRDGKD